MTNFNGGRLSVGGVHPLLAVLAALATGLLLALLTMVTVLSSQAEAVPRVSAATGPTGFPVWYQDADGTRLELCLDGPPLCLANEADLVPPDGEAFWWSAEAQMADIGVGGGGQALLVLAVEAAFDDAGEPIAFGRIRVRADNLRPNTVYTATHPYGVIRARTDAGGELRVSRDVGANTPNNFETALRSPVFDNFLRWNRNVPAGHLGNPNVLHKVIGSPRGTNFFLLEGPDVGGRGDDNRRTELFAVQGKRF